MIHDLNELITTIVHLNLDLLAYLAAAAIAMYLMKESK